MRAKDREDEEEIRRRSSSRKFRDYKYALVCYLHKLYTLHLMVEHVKYIYIERYACNASVPGYTVSASKGWKLERIGGRNTNQRTVRKKQ